MSQIKIEKLQLLLQNNEAGHLIHERKMNSPHPAIMRKLSKNHFDKKM